MNSADPRYDYARTAPIVLLQISAIVKDHECLEWFRKNGVQASSFYKAVEGLVEIAEAYRNYSEFLKTVIDKNQRH